MSDLAARGGMDTKPLESSGFPFAVVIGAVLGILGLATAGVAVALREDAGLLTLGVFLFAIGVVRLVTSFAKNRRTRRAYLASPNDPRWQGGAHVQQLAGRCCDACSGRIIIGAEARTCKRCGAPLHKDCAPRHRAQMHPRQHSKALA